MKATEKGIKDSMSSSKASKSETAELAAKTVARLYFLDLSAGRILTSNPDGSDLKTIVNEGRKLPDGIVVDVARGHIYWTNMGNPKANDGTIDRADLDGTNVTNIVPSGATWTPSSSSSTRRTGNSTGRTAKECESCARISMARTSKRSLKRVMEMPTALMRGIGALVSRLM